MDPSGTLWVRPGEAIAIAPWLDRRRRLIGSILSLRDGSVLELRDMTPFQVWEIIGRPR